MSGLDRLRRLRLLRGWFWGVLLGPVIVGIGRLIGVLRGVSGVGWTIRRLLLRVGLLGLLLILLLLLLILLVLSVCGCSEAEQEGYGPCGTPENL